MIYMIYVKTIKHSKCQYPNHQPLLI